MTIIETAITPLGDDPHTWATFASDIPLPVGIWPMDILVIAPGDQTFHFQRATSLIHHGEFAGFLYGDGDGHTLKIYND